MILARLQGHWGERFGGVFLDGFWQGRSCITIMGSKVDEVDPKMLQRSRKTANLAPRWLHLSPTWRLNGYFPSVLGVGGCRREASSIKTFLSTPQQAPAPRGASAHEPAARSLPGTLAAQGEKGALQVGHPKKSRWSRRGWSRLVKKRLSQSKKGWPWPTIHSHRRTILSLPGFQTYNIIQHQINHC